MFKESKQLRNAAQELKVARDNLRTAKKNKADSQTIAELEKDVANKAYIHNFLFYQENPQAKP